MYILLNLLKTQISIFALAILAYTIILAIIRRRMFENGHKVIFRLLCLLPAAAAVAHFFFFGIKNTLGYGTDMTLELYLYLYISAALPLLLMLPAGKNWFRRLVSTITSIAVFATSVLTVFMQIDYSKVHNFSELSCSESFKKTIDVMREEYVLSDWKNINYNDMLNEYLPKIEEAEKTNDKAAYCQVMTEFKYRFYDNHVGLFISPDVSQKVAEKFAGHDYGFSMYTLDNKKTVAVCVDEKSSAYKAGIRNGTVITKWDKTPIDKAVAKTECIYTKLSFAVKSNEDCFRPIFLAGKGNGKVKVSFIGKNGKEHEAALSSQGCYFERLENAIQKLLSRDISQENFSTKMLSDNCGYLRITEEYYDFVTDNQSIARKGKYTQLTEFYDQKLEELKGKGMKSLVIDLRNNSGGYNSVGGALVSLFTDKKQFMFSFGEKKGSGYKRTEDHYIYPNGRWKDLPVVVLVNQGCTSAGDGLAYFLSKCSNVTVMGITASSGVNQNNGGVCYQGDADTVLYYPDYLTLDEDGKPLIDTDESRENRVPLDVKIPVDNKVAMTIFGENGSDYQSDHAQKYLEK